MSTIASDGRTVAVNGLVLCDGAVICRAAQKLHLHGGRLYAYTGPREFMQKFLAWHAKGANPAATFCVHEDSLFNVVVFEPSGVAYRFCGDDDAVWTSEVVEFPMSAGSGSGPAIGALLAGASPERAIEIAAMVDPLSTGAVEHVDLADVLGGSWARQGDPAPVV